MKAIFSLVATIFFTAGCDEGIGGQIEKCVQAKIRASQEYEGKKGMWDTKSSTAQQEADARQSCLRAGSGAK